jgi:hypothetical protein
MKIQLDDRIIASDAFLSLSHTAQCLYYALFRTRDGDGVVNKTKSVMMGISQDHDICSEQHLKELIDGSFVIDYRKTDGVIIIKHHWLHTTYKSDRYVGSTYDCVNHLFIKDNGVYTEDETQGKPYLESVWKNNGKKLEKNWKKNGTKMFPQSNLIKSNLIKSNLLKNIGDKNIADECESKVEIVENEQKNTIEAHENHDLLLDDDAYTQRFNVFWKAYGNKKGSKAKVHQWFKTRKVSDKLLGEMLKAIEIDDKARQQAIENNKFYPEKPFAQTWLNQRRWETILENATQINSNERNDSGRENIPPNSETSPSVVENGENNDLDMSVYLKELEEYKKGGR